MHVTPACYFLTTFPMMDDIRSTNPMYILYPANLRRERLNITAIPIPAQLQHEIIPKRLKAIVLLIILFSSNLHQNPVLLLLYSFAATIIYTKKQI